MNVPLENCVQLGYYCMQLPKMLADPKQAFGSLESGETDVRNMRQWNRLSLPSDNNGLPTGDNEYLRKTVRKHELFWIREL